MKITNFSFTVRQAITGDGYGDNYYVNIDENGNTNVSHPYKTISHEEQATILSIIQTGIIQYGLLVKDCDRANKRLKLEEYAESVSSAETSSKPASLQTCALGDGEVSTGADGDIDKPQPTIVITKVTEEDDW